MDKKLISLELSKDLIEQLKARAEKDELSMSAIIRLALKAYLAKIDEK